MSDTRPPKDGQVQPGDATAPLSGVIKKAQGTVETARDLLARTHQAIDTTRQHLKSKEEILQYNQARRERQAEQTASHATTVSNEAGIDILLISDSAPYIARFRHALQESALPGQMKVLTERSDVKAFVRRAATAAPLFLPRLIITERQLPGMETEEIVAAVRTVPAYLRIPILLFSALEEAEGQRRWLQCGATAFVYEPRTWEAYVSAVASMVHRWDGGGTIRIQPGNKKKRAKRRTTQIESATPPVPGWNTRRAECERKCLGHSREKSSQLCLTASGPDVC